MFIPLKYGTKRVLVSVHDPYPFQCPNCKQLGTVDFAIYSEYYHFYYMPVFPFEKDGYAKCDSCEFHINSIKFNRLTKEEFKRIKKQYKHPFYTYIGITLLLSPFIIGLALLLFT